MHETLRRQLTLLFLVLAFVVSACGTKAVPPPAADRGLGYPLHEAVQQDNVARVSELLGNVVDLNGKDADGWTPLMVAVSWQKPEMVRLLLDRGANVQARNGEEDTALHIATRAGRAGPSVTKETIEIVDLLISRGADLEAKPDTGFTPLHQAAAWSRVKIAELLLKKGAKVNSRTDGSRGSNPLHAAVIIERSYPMAKLLVDYGADLRARAGWGDTPLHTALINGSPNSDIVKLFLDRGADVNSRMERGFLDWHLGCTPLHLAVSLRETGIAEILLSRGADVNAKNAKGITPLGLARYSEKRFTAHNYKDIIELLRKNGAHE